jgi:tRNA dimethylallyltransferase
MKYIIICGPTCTGKTGLGVELALRYDGEIINADSRQIYKHTRIGTARPTEGEMKGIRHHLFAFLELSVNFSAYQYAEMARAVLHDISRRGKLPIVVGGTGLYLKALTEGIFKTPSPDKAYRNELEVIAQKSGSERLHSMLSKIDPDSASRIKTNDRVRLIRALEIFKQTGRLIRHLQKSGEYIKPSGNPKWIGLVYNREELYQKINARVDNMIERGFEQELLDLKPFIGYIRGRKMIGYSDMIAYLYDRLLTREQAIEKVKQHHRNYAKRQLTWFKRVDNVNWFNLSQGDRRDEIYRLCDKYLKKA